MLSFGKFTGDQTCSLNFGKIFAGIFVSAAVFADARFLPVMRGIGGDFSAPASIGKNVRLSDFRGDVVLLTFGFTNCPDVCPITLGYLDFVVSQLKKSERERVKVLFVTVDPEYDTPAHLKQYLATFNETFIGLSPAPENLAEIAEKFQVHYEKIEDVRLETRHNRPRIEREKDDTFNMFNHSISIFLIDKNSKVRAIHYSGSSSEKVVAEISQLLGEANAADKNPKADDENLVVARDFWIRLLHPNAKTSALFGRVENSGRKPLRLVNIRCDDFAEKTELHLTKISDRQARMMRRDFIEISPKNALEMRPGSYHTMIFGIDKNQFFAGNKIPCALEFSDNRVKKFDAVIQRR